ncbi:FtsB family cell division protein [Demequina sp. SO4-13]|uniref:FtsB family cell division protein n=1 Tax=Demequina sp. SO4-13 TaxID=3401027 RepID=UPI003AF5E402
MPTPAPALNPARPRGSWTAMLTWRAAVILLVVALAIAVVAPSVRAYVDQQSTLAELREDATVAQAEVDDLNAELARWDDRAFIVAQARERLAYVFPGETPFRVVDAETVDGPAAGSPAAERQPEVAAGAPWYDRLWDSVLVAGGDAPVKDVEQTERPDGATGSGEGEEEVGESEPLTDVDFGG